MAVTPRLPHGEKTSLKQALLIRVANIASDMRRQEPTFGLSKFIISWLFHTALLIQPRLRGSLHSHTDTQLKTFNFASHFAKSFVCITDLLRTTDYDKHA